MSKPGIEVERRGPVGWIWLNRPEVHNAFDATFVDELTVAFTALGSTPEVRAIVLGARGKSFCAGAQVQWMQQQGAATPEENLSDARRLAGLFETIATCTKPTIARVQGAAIGGGLGLVAACDIAVGASIATFATSEVRLGLIPAVISPYVVRAVGERHARRLFLTAERVDGVHAERMGLLHIVADPETLDGRIDEVLRALLAGAPTAQMEAKSLLRAVAQRPITSDLVEETVQRIARCRANAEAAEGLAAFIEKRAPSWEATP